MHMSIVWWINDLEKTREITERIVATLAAYERVQVFPYAYVVKIPNVEASSKLTTALIELATTFGNAFTIICSPPINGGRYSGRIAVSLWAEVNRITE